MVTDQWPETWPLPRAAAGLRVGGRWAGRSGRGPGRVSALLLPGPSRTRARGRWETLQYDGRAGKRAYAVYVPRGRTWGGPRPVVVVLHGCRQSAADAAAGTRLNALADRHGFLVVYPEQSVRHNAHACWNWFRAGHQHRGAGEPAVIAGITKRVLRADLPVTPDPSRVYVLGLSAGGAMAAILGAAYPDVYAAVGVHSGVPYRAACSGSAALDAMRAGGSDPEEQARLAHDAMGSLARVVPLVVVHGDEDRTVWPGTGERLVRQWLTLTQLASAGELRPEFDGPDATWAGRSRGGLSYQARAWTDARGRPVVEHWRVFGLGHAWSGGSTAGSYVDPRGPDAAVVMHRFLSRHRLDAARWADGVGEMVGDKLRRLFHRRAFRRRLPGTV